MYFLLEASQWLSNTVDDGIMGAIEKGARTISFSLATFIYELIINLYNLFETLCTARLLDSTLLNEISTRVGLILGLVMFFIITFSFIKMLIDPDSMEDKQKGFGSIIKKTLIVIVLLGTTNFAFDALYYVQRIIVKDHIISNLLLPYKINDENMNNFGAVLSEEMMYSFYRVEDFADTEEIDSNSQSKINRCKNFETAFRNQIINQHKFDLGYNCLNESVTVSINTGTSIGNQQQEIFMVKYNWLLCVVAGVVVVYLLLMYCIKIGVRMVQLMFLEVIAPMAIVSYLAPKNDTMFSKWGKLYFATYIDVFIRIAIINFIVFLCATILTTTPKEGFIFWESIGNPTDTGTVAFFKVVIILALLVFAKKAPDLIKELVPASASKLGYGGVGFKDLLGGNQIKKGLNRVGKTATGIVGGATAGAAIGLLGGGLGGFAGGFFKGGLSGLKGQGLTKTATSAWKNQKELNKKIADVRANGGSSWGYRLAQLQKNLGMRTTFDNLENEYRDAAEYVKGYKSMKKTAEGEVNKHLENYKFRDSVGNEMTLAELEMAMTDTNRYDEKTLAQYKKIYQQIHGFARDQAMNNGGALKNGEMIWTDDGSGDWNKIKNNRTDSFDKNSDIAYEGEIQAQMQSLLNSGYAGASGTDFERAKEAYDHFENKSNEKINDDKYRAARANSGQGPMGPIGPRGPRGPRP